MGKGLAGLIGSGIGFTSEAIHAARNHKKDSISASLSPPASIAPHSIPDVEGETDQREPPRRDSELQTQEELSTCSPCSSLQSKAAEAGYPSDVGENKTNQNFRTQNGSDEVSIDTGIDQDRMIDGDEAAWQLDEATEEFGLPTYDQSESKPAIEDGQRDLEMRTKNNSEEISSMDSEDEQAKKREQMINELVAMAGLPPAQPQRLPCPVIIPQRRPGSKRRGFVRAYAPVLAQCGISQDVFLKFISDFHKASQASMWLQVIVVAAKITSFSPSLAVALTAAAIQIVADTAQQLQIRHRTNTYLDRANQEIFMPRGQYAMIMKFTDQPLKSKKQNASSFQSEADRLGGLFSTEQISFDQSGALPDMGPEMSQPERPEFDAAMTISKFTHSEEHPQMSAWKQHMKHYRLESGTSQGEMQLPECAPLVFPEIDRAAIRIRDGLEPKSKFQSGRTWVQDYMDRKSQASFEAKHKGSAVSVPESGRKAFNSRYNDPKHPVNSGNLLSALSGGLYKPKPSLFSRAEAAIKESQDKKRAAQGLPPSETLKQKWAKKKGDIGSRIKILSEDVMYLMIVNMPTEEELRESVARLQYLAQQEDLGRDGAGGATSRRD